jgi:hypothetical protein
MLALAPALIGSNPVYEITAEGRNLLHEAARNGKIEILVRYVNDSKAEYPDATPGDLMFYSPREVFNKPRRTKYKI